MQLAELQARLASDPEWHGGRYYIEPQAAGGTTRGFAKSFDAIVEQKPDALTIWHPHVQQRRGRHQDQQSDSNARSSNRLENA